MSEEHKPETPAEKPAESHEGHGHHDHPAPANPFSNSEVASMHDEDRRAAGNIVVLMLAIFVAGVIGYMVVGYVCSMGA
jgi:hypothetical protein